MRLLLTLSFLLPVIGQQVKREAIEWTDVWMPHSNDHDLPRVLLIGDSIARAYFAGVEENLKGKAYVARIATSKAIGDPALVAELEVFMKQAEFDVVHFNIGMHGWAYSEQQYREGWPALLAVIRRSAPKAKLIWASTTPVRKDREGGATNERIAERNNAARKLAEAADIAVDDLYAVMVPHPDLHSDDVHFNKDGSTLLADQVASKVVALLK